MPGPSTTLISGQPHVEVAPDGSIATLTLPEGAPCDDAVIRSALKAAGVSAGLHLERLVGLRPGESVIVAEAIPAVDGSDGQVELIVGRPGPSGFTPVKAGQPVLKRNAPGHGKWGMTVQGHPLHWRPGQPCSLPPLGAGVEVSVHEPDVVVATVSGAFRLGEDGMLQVDDTLMVDVQQHPAPIDFPGNVTLEGGFAAGINLKAGGDVLVHGGIEHADIEAFGSITVEGGILSSQVRSGGTVRAKLAREATIEAGEDVALSQECVNCEVTAQGEIAVCGARCHGGQIMGGHLKAGSRIVTFDVGVPTSGRTMLEAGQGWVRARRLKDLDHEIELCRPEIDRLESELVRVANNPAYKGSVEGVKTDLYDAWEKLRPLEAARTELAEATAKAASIEVHGTIQARVRLDVDGVSYEVERACARQRFAADRTKNEIKQEDLK